MKTAVLVLSLISINVLILTIRWTPSTGLMLWNWSGHYYILQHPLALNRMVIVAGVLGPSRSDATIARYIRENFSQIRDTNLENIKRLGGATNGFEEESIYIFSDSEWHYDMVGSDRIWDCNWVGTTFFCVQY